MLISQNQLSIPEDQKTSKIADLELFKMLLQPHFLFNSLNNLYALSIKKSDQTATAIAGLSELLEKVVTSARQEYIPLSQEVDLIRGYINLEKIWLGETSFLLDLQVSGDTDSMMVPPLLLYTFVENCFKHGIRKCGGDGWTTIKVEVRKNTLYFTAQNQVPVYTDKADASKKDRSGFGVFAARELLERKCCGNYDLKHSLSGNVYSVKLKIAQLNKISA